MKQTILILIFSALGIVASAQDTDPLDAAILSLVDDAPRHRLNNAEARAAFVDDLSFAANTHGLDPYLVLTIAFYESSLSTLAVGGRGEVGLMQVHGDAARGCELTTQRGQLLCGSAWLAKAHEACGTWTGAVTYYATGECKTRSERVKRIVEFRIAKWEMFKGAGK